MSYHAPIMKTLIRLLKRRFRRSLVVEQLDLPLDG